MNDSQVTRSVDSINELRNIAFREGKLQMLDELMANLAEAPKGTYIGLRTLINYKQSLKSGWDEKGLKYK